MVAGGDFDGEGAARRRRQRRLRSWLKHERQSVAMALAKYTHHASRGQTRARAREEVEHEKHDGPRAQKPPLPGRRSGVPTEPEAQGPAVIGAHVAAGPPLLVVASLSGGTNVDATSFLLRESLSGSGRRRRRSRGGVCWRRRQRRSTRRR